jgi:hypothetical protein
MVRTTHQQKSPNKTSSRSADAQRIYRHQLALATGPDADARRSRETTLHRERQARARSRPLSPTLSPTALSSRRIHQLELHRDRQREYRARLRARCENHPPPNMPSAGDPMLVDIPKVDTPTAPRVPSPSPSHSIRVHQADHTKQQRCGANRQIQPVHTAVNNDHELDTPPYIPLHQQQAIHAFLNSVRDLGDNINECRMCKERYYGMKLEDMQCARCVKEVCHADSSHISFPDPLAFLSDRLNIATMTRTMLTLVVSLQNSMTSSPTSPRWKKCSAASPHPAS